MEKIRVLLANHPRMVPDAIRQLVAEQEDIEVVADCRGPIRILQEAGRTKADAVILAQEGSDEPGLCSQLLAVYPDLTIVSFASDMEKTFVQQLRSSRQEMGQSQIQDIPRVLRAALHAVCREK